MSHLRFRYARIVMLLLSLVGMSTLLPACGTKSTNEVTLPLAEGKPTFMFFYTDN